MGQAPKPCSVLSLDVGRRRIGLAGCDALGITVRPLPALHRGRFETDLPALVKLCRSRGVVGLVVGMPLDDRGNPRHRRSTAVATATDSPWRWVFLWLGSMNTAAVGQRASGMVWPEIAADAWTALKRRCSYNRGFKMGRITHL